MNWEDRSIKMKAREWLLEQIPSALSVNYAGLSAGQAIFEKMLCETRDVRSLRLYEKDPEIYAELMRTVYDAKWDVRSPFPENTLPLRGSIDTFVNTHSGDDLDFPYPNLLWLDYCGPITMERIETLKTALRQRPRGGYVVVTFLACREPKSSTEFIDQMEGVSTIYIEEGLTPAYFLKKIRAVAEVGLGVDDRLAIKALPYKDGAPMMMIVFSDANKRPVLEIEPYLKE